MDFDASGALKSSLTTKTGAIEEIWVYALANDRIASTAYSKTYPNDKIQYDWTYNATLVNGSPAKGRISERIDEWNNRTDYDHREIKFLRYDDGSGNYTSYTDNGNASQEFLTFGNSYGAGGIIYDNWLGDFYSIGALGGQEYGNNVFNGSIIISNKTSALFANNTFSGYVQYNTFSGYIDNNTFTFTSLLSYSDMTGVISSKTIDETTYPFLFGTDYEKRIFKASDNNVYARYFDGTNDINVLIP